MLCSEIFARAVGVADLRSAGGEQLRRECGRLEPEHGASIGYDVTVHQFVPRYGLGIGMNALFWDFGTEAPRITNYS